MNMAQRLIIKESKLCCNQADKDMMKVEYLNNQHGKQISIESKSI
jgi:hypothetical protein